MPQPTWVPTLAMTLEKHQVRFFTPELRAVLATADHPSTRQPTSLAVVRELALYSTTVLVPERINTLSSWSESDLQKLVQHITRWSGDQPTNYATVSLVHALQHYARYRASTDATARMLWPAARLLSYGYPYDPVNPDRLVADPRPTTMPKAVADFLTVCHYATLRDWVIGERVIREVVETIKKVPPISA